ncbi:1-(5-phosphoribosyl)-5-[(5-phosphoribosylamino)methylideneamino]imidazole-4-carboxamide isomerase [Dictyoglomus thermophilum]|uniref:1-(5-phosphoribosyl)-5-[(5-phosphoribosylamino)methylideneamino] imidazole-4-carboxamide isomerase n=1 Tax=Dictyoglomus thermophilum (strain ATCC 35947 / DSM 3960 / H-6-12) TaxID=309799 RepID=HIS4_DICT6|nr:HisA/HisF-related TIM barrel protein [Dictyoglomus thermophilum]B5YE89.1 RecName: Full=1-(5-phosphoribosyl)-5-[(5-phosphoribosylamino)methylideneamino] imidazole-4-carboxamide isomerase; AltName: Full=Phosphoribosylformimino-5-aminoimidazole carboxamide ribotide isomerase [Dictyoglomus thermophilum H-6-12]ACI18593.1 1-(5-phosphoribosyl)-5-[(5-phosphoribosylamino)methylideneamino]imidazole-4-carboxamide isomerase [Dictyoglomus thermophilum H-6-12]MCX7720995.1 HisA/HisF-related TIM barrel prote
MLIIPAIDIYKHKVVRMETGKKEKIVLEFNNPLDLAKYWEEKGAKALHLIDLQSAIDANDESKSIVRDIVRSVSIPVEVGGGYRSREKIEEAISWGVWRVIVSSILGMELDYLLDLFSKYENKIIPSIDWYDGKVGIKGWQDFIEWRDIKRKIDLLKVREVIFTDISRDGTLKGVNLENIKNFLSLHDYDVWIAGGISSIEDVIKIKDLSENTGRIKGIIIGRALLEGKINWEEAKKIIDAS